MISKRKRKRRLGLCFPYYAFHGNHDVIKVAKICLIPMRRIRKSEWVRPVTASAPRSKALAARACKTHDTNGREATVPPSLRPGRAFP